MSAELTVYCTVSLREALMDLAPEFEHASGHKLTMNYGSGPELSQRIAAGLKGDVFVGPDDFTVPLIKQGALAGDTRAVVALSKTALAVRAGAPKPDISTPEKLKRVLLAAKSVSYSKGASGLQFMKMLNQLGIADAVAAKLVPPQPGELVGAVVVRGAADIAVQQVSELLPVAGIVILEGMPPALQEPITYTVTSFAGSQNGAVAQAFVQFLKSEAARAVLRHKGLDPA